MQSGAGIKEALNGAAHLAPDDRVVEAAIAMMAEDGEIDMKRLAVDAGMSRASLYRHYADRHQVEAEIASIGLIEMDEQAALHNDPADRFRAVAAYLRSHPAQALAVCHLASGASVEALASSAELLVGARQNAATVMGIVLMIASAHRSQSSGEEIDAIIEAAAARVG